MLDPVPGAIGCTGSGRVAEQSCVQIWKFWSRGAVVKGHSGPRAAINAVVERPEVSKCLNHGAWACLTWCEEPRTRRNRPCGSKVVCANMEVLESWSCG